MNRLNQEYLQKKYGIKSIWCQRYCSFLGKFFPKKLAHILYKKQFGKQINWGNPININEKINWLAFNTDTSLWSVLADKISVREYIIRNGYADILPGIYGVWDNAIQIEYAKLPQKFVLKCNHDSGSVILVDDKSTIDKENIERSLNENLFNTFGVISAEPHYQNINKKIFAEEYIERENLMLEYKFWCFRGSVEYCHVDIRKNFFDIKQSAIYHVNGWTIQKQALNNTHGSIIEEIPRPQRLSEMLEIASTLTKNFPQCRVDLYESNGRIFFGEMTFTSCCGRICDYSDAFLIELGNKVTLKDG